MIDAVFLLIIFFLCIDFRVLESKLPVQLPTDLGRPIYGCPTDDIRVRVHCDAVGIRRLRHPDQGHRSLGGRRLAKPVALVGHEIHWTVGPRRIDSIDGLKRELARFVEDRDLLVPAEGRPGEVEPRQVELTPLAGTTYGDVAWTLDAIQSVGLQSVRFGTDY